jgi:Fusaric acid resistance protein-like
MPSISEVLTRTVDAALDRFRKRGRRAIGWVLRLTLAAVASFVVATLVFSTNSPLLAPLTSMLVIQLTPVSLLVSGVQRVASVVVGVIVAVLLSSLVHITWWSLGTVIAVSLIIGQLLRLGSNLLEVPISAMLVLGVGSRTADSAAWQRIAETLVGASVGVLSNLVFPPKVTTEDAAVAIENLGDELARLLTSAADDVVGEDLGTTALRERATRWLDEARRITHDIPNVGMALIRAEESRRLNVRALGTANTGPGLRHGLEALEHSALALRSMLRSFVEAAQGYEQERREIPADLRAAVARLLNDLAAAVHAFGQLIRVDAEMQDPTAAVEELRDALTNLQATQARVTERLGSEPRGDTILAVLTVSLLATVRRLRQELDIDQRATPTPRPSPLVTLRTLPHVHGLAAKERRYPWRSRARRRRHGET